MPNPVNTKHFQLFADDSFGAAGEALRQAMAQTVETDYKIYSSWFGGVQVDSFDLHADPGDNGASHFDCGARDIHFDWRLTKTADWARMLADSEIGEVFMSNIDAWDCGNSTGEGLSRVLAECIYPGNVAMLNGKTPAAVWLDGSRPDWVTKNDGTDENYESIGCSVLFLNWLRYQLGFQWENIIGVTQNLDDGMTLEQIYAQLHNISSNTGAGWKAFKAFLDKHFPPGKPWDLETNNPFPLPGQEKWSGWSAIGAPATPLSITLSPGVASGAVNRLDVCVNAHDGTVWLRRWNGQSWELWRDLGGNIASGVAAVATSVFVANHPCPAIS